MIPALFDIVRSILGLFAALILLGFCFGFGVAVFRLVRFLIASPDYHSEKSVTTERKDEPAQRAERRDGGFSPL